MRGRGSDQKAWAFEVVGGLLKREEPILRKRPHGYFNRDKAKVGQKIDPLLVPSGVRRISWRKGYTAPMERLTGPLLRLELINERKAIDPVLLELAADRSHHFL
jgi:hypothetical protein